MKIKKIHVTAFLFSLLVLVGISPPSSNEYNNAVQNTNIIEVYAANDTDITSGAVSYKDAGFVGAVNSYLNEHNLLSGKDYEKARQSLLTNLDESLGTFNKYLTTITDSMSGLMTSLCVLTVAIIGWQYMNSGKGNLFEFVKNKEKLYNAALAMIFVMAIPTFIDGVNGITVSVASSKARTATETPSKYTINLNDTNASKISDVFVTPSSYLTELYKDTTFEKNNNGGFLVAKKVESGKKGILGTMESILMFLLKFLYEPFHFVMSIIGLIAFYPMSFDPEMYGTTVVSKISSSIGGFDTNAGAFFKLITGGSADNIVNSAVSAIANSFSSVILIVNLIAGIMKKICLSTLKIACYLYGFKVLTGMDHTKVKDYIMKILQCVLGIFTAPLIIQTLLDVDGLVSSALLGLAGKSVPGIGMLNLLVTPDVACANLANFIFALAMLAVMFFIMQTFLFRRIEIIMYYIMAPAMFLKELFSQNGGTVKLWFERVSSAIFINTSYAPLFVTINFLLIFGNVIDNSLNRIIYFIIVWFITYKSKDLVLMCVDWLFGGKSVSDKMMAGGFNKGLNYTNNKISDFVRNPVGTMINTADEAFDMYKKPINGIKDYASGVIGGAVEGVGELAGRTSGFGQKSVASVDAFKHAIQNPGQNATLTRLRTAFDVAKANSENKITQEPAWFTGHINAQKEREEALKAAGIDERDLGFKPNAKERFQTMASDFDEKKASDVAWKNAVNTVRNSEEFKGCKFTTAEEKEAFQKAVQEKYESDFTSQKSASLVSEVAVKDANALEKAIEETFDESLFMGLAESLPDKSETKKMHQTIMDAAESFKNAAKDFKDAQEKGDTTRMLDALAQMDKSKSVVDLSGDVSKLIGMNSAISKTEELRDNAKTDVERATHISTIASQKSQQMSLSVDIETRMASAQKAMDAVNHVSKTRNDLNEVKEKRENIQTEIVRLTAEKRAGNADAEKKIENLDKQLKSLGDDLSAAVSSYVSAKDNAKTYAVNSHKNIIEQAGASTYYKVNQNLRADNQTVVHLETNSKGKTVYSDGKGGRYTEGTNTEGKTVYVSTSGNKTVEKNNKNNYRAIDKNTEEAINKLAKDYKAVRRDIKPSPVNNSNNSGGNNRGTNRGTNRGNYRGPDFDPVKAAHKEEIIKHYAGNHNDNCDSDGHHGDTFV